MEKTFCMKMGFGKWMKLAAYYFLGCPLTAQAESEKLVSGMPE